MAIETIAAVGNAADVVCVASWNADLVSQERSGRNLIYRAQFDRMNALLGFLTQNCCQGQACLSPAAELCDC